MSAYVNESRQQASGPLAVLMVLGGLVWMAVVVWFLGYGLERAEIVAAQGVIAEPSSAQVVVAYMLAVLFALPGAGLIVYGLARLRRAGGHGRGEASG